MYVLQKRGLVDTCILPVPQQSSSVQKLFTNILLLFQACFQKSGASVVAIRKYIIHKYPSLELERRGYLLKQALKRELERGIIRQVRVALWSSGGCGITELHSTLRNSVSWSLVAVFSLCLCFVRHGQIRQSNTLSFVKHG